MLKLYNSLGRELQEFKPIKKDNNKKEIWIYTCGPTVYHYVTIGNWRTYVLGDIIVRTLEYLYPDYKIKYVMNITDVGHLTGDNLGDSSTGEDRMEKAEKREGKNAWEIADFYSKDFFKGMKLLNMREPDKYCKATNHIKEQISFIKKIKKAGYVYKIKDGLYFDVKKYENDGYLYGELSNLDKIKEGARVAINKEKKDPRDFALWKFSPKNKKRHMEWQSPWGIGFPGWHIECSAMSMKYLGEQFDIHVGGEDLKSTHHPCEIAQAESVTKKRPFVKYWLHGAFITIDGGRMGKSLGNAYTLTDINNYKFKDKNGLKIEKKGDLPLNIKALRFFYYSGHYRSSLNFTWKAFESSRISLGKLTDKYKEYSDYTGGKILLKYKKLFLEALNDDLNMPKTISIVWKLVKSNEKEADKKETLRDFDKVLGLGLNDIINNYKKKDIRISNTVKELLEKRHLARKKKDWKKSDQIRNILKGKYGFEVVDKEGEQYLKEI